MSVNKFLLANQVKWVQIPISYCPHMFHHAPLPHCYCTKCIFLPSICPPIIHICEQPSPAYQVGSNPHCPLSSYTTSWGPGKHSMSPPGCRPQFLKPKCHKESKNGFKPINFRSPCKWFFQITFSVPKIIKKIGRFLDFLDFYHTICA